MEEQEVSTKTKVAGFLHDVRSEFDKISWPTRSELLTATWIVAVIILLLAGIVFLFDQVLLHLLNLVIK